MTIDHKEILHELLFDKHLTEDEFFLLDDLIEDRIYKLDQREPKEEVNFDIVELGRLELLRYKITKWRGAK